MPHLNPHALLARLDALEDILKLGFDSIRKLRTEIREANSQDFPPVPTLGSNDFRLPLSAPTTISDETQPDPDWIPILHRIQRLDASFPPPCGKVGLYLTELPREHQIADLAVMRIRTRDDPRWHTPQRGIDVPCCSTCFAFLDPFSNADLDYLSVMQPSQVGDQTYPRSRPLNDRGVVGASARDSEISPGLLDVSLAPPPLPGHTPDAMADVLQDLQNLRDLAKSAGLPDTDD